MKNSEKLHVATLINQAEYANRLYISRPYISLVMSGNEAGKSPEATYEY